MSELCEIDEYLTIVAFVALLTLVFCSTWQMFAAAGAVALGCVVVAVWRERQ